MTHKMSPFRAMVDILPEGKKGNAKIKHVRVGKEDAGWSGLRAIVTGNVGEVIREGGYVQLFVNGCLAMSDTQMEKRSNYGVVWNAKGNVLIAGLGVGMILLPILEMHEVKSVTVIEKSQDVIDLVEPHIRKAAGRSARKLTVLCADIFEWQPPKGETWDCIYFDIWSEICTDNLDDMAKLHRRFARRKNPGGWMNSWMKSDLRYRRQQERRQDRFWR